MITVMQRDDAMTRSSKRILVEDDSLIKNPIRYQFKIILLGDGGSGKTCLTNRFCYNVFKDTKLTIGLSFNSYSIQAQENEKKFRIGLSIWDFGGQRRFKPLLPQFITGASGALLVHDLTSFHTLLNLENEWVPLLRKNAGNIPLILLGTKLDLKNELEVNQDSINSIQDNIGVLASYETSSVTGIGVDEAFKRVVREILNKPPYDKRDIEIL